MKYMLKKKKAMELSITVIIVAILGLIVLVVMIYIFGQGTSDAVKTLKTCAAKGGECKASGDCDGTKLFNIKECKDKNPSEICCIEI